MIIDDFASKVQVVTASPSIHVHEVFRQATDPTLKPLWETDSRFLDAFEEVEEVLTWCTIGERPAIEKAGLTSIASKPKEGKSASMYALLMHLLIGKPFGNMKPSGEPPRLCIVFDTEMPTNDLKRRIKTIKNTIGEEVLKRLLIVPLKSVPKAERVPMIKDICDRYNPEIIAIDTITRLVEDFNATTETIAFSEIILPMAEYRTIICITHFTTGTDKMKGHLGSMLEELSAENYGVSRKDGIIEMKVKNARNTDTENATPFKFTQSSEGQLIDYNKIAEEVEERIWNAYNANFINLFGDAEKLCKQDLQKVIKEKEGLEKSSADTKIAEALRLGVLRNKREGRNVFYSLTRPLPI